MQSKTSFCTAIRKEFPSWDSKFEVIGSDAVSASASVSCSSVEIDRFCGDLKFMGLEIFVRIIGYSN